MVIAGANFALLYRVVRAAPAARRCCATRSSGSTSASCSLASAVAPARAILAEGTTASGRGGGPPRGLPGRSRSMTTTGIASTDFNAWPLLALVTLIGLMFIGGSAGSTAGSIKVVRHLLIGRILRRELEQTVHPEVVAPDPAEPAPRSTSGSSRAVLALRPALRRPVRGRDARARRRRRPCRARPAPFDAIAAAATTLGNVGPALRLRRADGLVRALQRPLEAA